MAVLSRSLALLALPALWSVGSAAPCDGAGCTLPEEGAGGESSLLQHLADPAAPRAAGGRSEASGSPSTPGGARYTCPPPDVKPLADSDFNVTEFVRASWYVILQQLVPFQPPPLECVVATYDLATKKERFYNVPFFKGDIVLINNYQRNGQASLCGSVTDPSTTSALKVAPCFLPFPTFFGGDYWVIYVEYEEPGVGPEYKWAWVVGGAPTEQEADGCTTSGGLWLFSRTPTEPTEGDWSKATGILTSLGLSQERLVRVNQADCDYKGAGLKP